MKKTVYLSLILFLAFSCSKRSDQILVSPDTAKLIEELQATNKSVEEVSFFVKPRYSKIFLRDEPSLSSDIVGVLTSFDSAEVILKTSWKEPIKYDLDFWYMIKSEKIEGWCHSSFLLEDLSKVQSKIPIEPKFQKKSIQLIESDKKYNLEEFSDNPYVQEDLILPHKVQTRSELQQLFDQCMTFDEEDIVNRHDPTITDQIVKIRTESFHCVYYYISTKDYYFLAEYSLYSNQYNLKNKMYFGISGDEIISAFGEPNDEYYVSDEYDLHYYGDWFSIRFSIKKDMLVQISYMVTL